MDEYISREEAIKGLREVYENEYPTASGDFDEYASHDVPNVLRNIPSADVQPVKRGHWYHNTSKYISELDAYFIQACCSCCGKYSDRFDSYSQQMSNECCSHCGARMIMDGEQND